MNNAFNIVVMYRTKSRHKLNNRKEFVLYTIESAIYNHFQGDERIQNEPMLWEQSNA
jgi:hypothetical protein